MPDKTNTASGRLLLISAPWPLFNRPSLPLGALKAYLAQEIPGLSVAACHLFLNVASDLGYPQYQAISHRVWRAEAVFSALLYPHRAHMAKALYHRTATRGDSAPADFEQLVAAVGMHTDRWLRTIDWSSLNLVGFSISFCQVTASLYLISRIKAICPSLPVVVGGSSFSGPAAQDVLNCFPQIDFLVVGEGERPLADLVRHLLSEGPDRRSEKLLPGIVSRVTALASAPQHCQMKELGQLPAPDYDDYFAMLADLPPAKRFFPTLSLEASRGCWWRRQTADHLFKGCAFCNLNLQWRGYRAKTPNQVIGEVNHLVHRHRVLSLAFADNAFPSTHATEVIAGIRALGRDLSIFAELRADTPPDRLAAMRRAGVDTVQVGIEALSSRLLRKMNKGTRAIDNVSLMKYCEAYGIENASNLMLHFPGSDAADVAETLFALDFVVWFRPLKAVRFWLGLDSPVHRQARRFQIRSTFNHPNLKHLFPAEIADGFRFMIQGYRGDRLRQNRLWQPVRRKLRQWSKDYATLQKRTGGRPALTFRDGREFLMIDQHWPDRPVEHHRLTGDSAAIFRYCDVPRSLDAVSDAFGGHRRDQIRSFLQSMVSKRLMFVDNDHYVNLVVPVPTPAPQ